MYVFKFNEVFIIIIFALWTFKYSLKNRLNFKIIFPIIIKLYYETMRNVFCCTNTSTKYKIS